MQMNLTLPTVVEVLIQFMTSFYLRFIILFTPISHNVISKTIRTDHWVKFNVKVVIKVICLLFLENFKTFQNFFSSN